jgi:hypothetical protein
MELVEDGARHSLGHPNEWQEELSASRFDIKSTSTLQIPSYNATDDAG